MKVLLVEGPFAWGPRAPRAQALTLVEMMVTVAIFSLVVAGFVYVQMFGLRQDELANSKLGASDTSRRGFNLLGGDIRSAKIWQVGNGTGTNFTGIANGAAQQGNALQLSLTTDTNTYIRYYFNTNAGQLLRLHSGVAGTTLIAQNLTNNIAPGFTNSMSFRAEDYNGNVLTVLTHKGVISTELQFCQYQYPMTYVGPGYYYDFYRLQFKLTPHVPDGP